MPAAAWALFRSQDVAAPLAVPSLMVIVLTGTLPLLPQGEVHRAASTQLEAPLRFHAAMALTPARFSALAVRYVHFGASLVAMDAMNSEITSG